MKICYKCKQSKELTDFHKDKSTKDGLTNKCKVCKKTYYEDNYEREIARRKEYNDSHKEYFDKYKIDNKNEILKKRKIFYYKNRDRLLAEKKIYTKTEKARLSCINKHTKRKRIKEKSDLKTSDIKKFIDDSNNCYWCEKPLKGKYHIDHYVPLSRDGKHEIDNLVISCPKCNMSKGAKDPLEFAQTKGKLL